MKFFHFQRRWYHWQDTARKPVNTLCRITPLALLLCGCMLSAPSPNNAKIMAVTPCNSGARSRVQADIHLPPPYKIKLPEKHHYLVSERELQMSNIYNGAIYTENQFHDETRLPSHHKNKSLEDGWQSKPVAAWPSFEFKLNDRLQLGADLPDMKNLDNAGDYGRFVPIPRLTYDFGSVKITTLYIPVIQEYNLMSVMGLYLIIKF